jgi:hypothetical protein
MHFNMHRLDIAKTRACLRRETTNLTITCLVYGHDPLEDPPLELFRQYENDHYIAIYIILATTI